MFLLEFQDAVILKLEEILVKLNSITNQNRQIVATGSTSPSDKKYPSLPLKTLDEIDQIEQSITEEEQFLKLVNIF